MLDKTAQKIINSLDTATLSILWANGETLIDIDEVKLIVGQWMERRKADRQHISDGYSIPNERYVMPDHNC